jgi:hypothetical protein
MLRTGKGRPSGAPWDRPVLRDREVLSSGGVPAHNQGRQDRATLLVDLGVHPRVIMRILRHAGQAVTMEIYANASSAATQEALRRLGDILHWTLLH